MLFDPSVRTRAIKNTNDEKPESEMLVMNRKLLYDSDDDYELTSFQSKRWRDLKLWKSASWLAHLVESQCWNFPNTTVPVYTGHKYAVWMIIQYHRKSYGQKLFVLYRQMCKLPVFEWSEIQVVIYLLTFVAVVSYTFHFIVLCCILCLLGVNF